MAKPKNDLQKLIEKAKVLREARKRKAAANREKSINKIVNDWKNRWHDRKNT